MATIPGQSLFPRARWDARTGLDISSGVNDTSSGTTGAHINTDIVVHVRIEFIVRTKGDQQCSMMAVQCGVGRKSRSGIKGSKGKENPVAYSIEACREGFWMFLYGVVCDISAGFLVQ